MLDSRGRAAGLVIGVLALFWFPVTRSPAQTPSSIPLPRNAFVQTDGSVTFLAQPPASDTARPAAVPPAGPIAAGQTFYLPEIPLTKRTNLSKTDIETRLNVLFDGWVAAKATYAPYLLMLPGLLPLADAGSSLLVLPADRPLNFQPYNLHQTNVGITLKVPSQIATQDPFKPSGGAAGAPFQPAAVFVEMDPFGAFVPVTAAHIFETAFINGLVTRLVLEQYVAFWKGLPGSTININLNGGLGGAAGSGPLAAFSLAASYPAGKGLNDDLTTLMQQNPIPPFGMIFGWQAATELLNADKANGPTKPFTHAIWQLVNSRHSLEEIGRMTAYTLQYMSGFALNERLMAIGNGTTVPPQVTIPGAQAVSSSPGAPPSLAQFLASSPTFHSSKVFLVNFTKVLLGEYYAVSQNTTLNAADKLNLLTQYYYFIRGFQSGIIKASDRMFIEIGGTAYLIGYEQGYRDGFSAGYVAGWTAGYATGYQVAWAQAEVTITQLQQTIGNLESQLAAAQSNDSFWGQLGNIASVAGSVLGFIGSLF